MYNFVHSVTKAYGILGLNSLELYLIILKSISTIYNSILTILNSILTILNSLLAILNSILTKSNSILAILNSILTILNSNLTISNSILTISNNIMTISHRFLPSSTAKIILPPPHKKIDPIYVLDAITIGGLMEGPPYKAKKHLRLNPIYNLTVSNVYVSNNLIRYDNTNGLGRRSKNILWYKIYFMI